MLRGSNSKSCLNLKAGERHHVRYRVEAAVRFGVGSHSFVSRFQSSKFGFGKIDSCKAKVTDSERPEVCVQSVHRSRGTSTSTTAIETFIRKNQKKKNQNRGVLYVVASDAG
jgi:hypothetical protein